MMRIKVPSICLPDRDPDVMRYVIRTTTIFRMFKTAKEAICFATDHHLKVKQCMWTYSIFRDDNGFRAILQRI